eukprot:symbB.v1.2.015724.t1/scaffold1184.1/size176679/4
MHVDAVSTVVAATFLDQGVEWLNDYGGMLEDIKYSKVAAALEKVGAESAMNILKELEDHAAGIPNPTAFILRSSQLSQRSAPSPATPSTATPSKPSKSPKPAKPLTPMEALNSFMEFLNTGPHQKRTVKPSEVADALDALGPHRVGRILQEMREHGLGLDDPVSYIKAAAQRSAPKVKKEVDEGVGGIQADHSVDDVSKLTSRIKWLNQFGGLSKKINVDEVIGALYCLGVPQSMSILRGLQERGTSVPDPTRYIKQAVQRANSSMASAKQEKEEDEEDEEDPAEYEEVVEEEADAADGTAQEEIDAAKAEALEASPPEEDVNDIDEDWFDWAAAEQPKRSKKRSNEGVTAASVAVPAKAAVPNRPATPPAKVRRVVGGLTGYKQLVPARATEKALAPNRQPVLVKSEAHGEDAADEDPSKEEPKVTAPAPRRPLSSYQTLPMSPQEKMVQVKNYALKNSLDLDDHCIKALTRLPYFRAKDLIDEVVLGGRHRRGVSNPSRYLKFAVEKQSVGLGVEQAEMSTPSEQKGIAMELAVSLGVVLNNVSLDELASIPRQESHAIIRELAGNPSLRSKVNEYIRDEVLKCREQLKSLMKQENPKDEIDQEKYII